MLNHGDQVKDFEQQYQDRLITQGEKYNKVVDVWSKCSDDVATEMMKNISTVKTGEPVNSVWMMAHSGARDYCSNQTTCRNERPDG